MQCLRDAFANGYGYVREWVRTDPDFLQFHGEPEFNAFITEGV